MVRPCVVHRRRAVCRTVNSAFESAAKAITSDFDDHIRDSLDIASSAVLVVAVAAAIVGASIFIYRIGLWLDWWGGYYM